MNLLFDRLRAFGADPDETLERLLGDVLFFRTLLLEFSEDPDIQVLDKALREGDYPHAFHAAHNLKGAAATLGLAPVLRPLQRLTEALRNEPYAAFQADYAEFQEKLRELQMITGESERT